MNNVDYEEESDSSDEDYVPGGCTASGDVPSEVESDGDPEDALSDAEDTGNTKRTKQKKSSNSKKKKLTKNGSTTNNSSQAEEITDTSKSVEQITEEKKKHDDDLWASFKRDTGFKKKTTQSSSTTITNGTTSTYKSTSVTTTKPKQPDTVKITQIFEFAGEQVEVEKEVKADSAEARLSLSNSSNTAGSSSPGLNPGPKRKSGGLGGIGSVLSQINKKQKLSVLEKTKLDWNQYKKKESIEDELESYKKGKDGYLEKQDFLQRADERQFEIEKEVRAVERSRRMNNAP